MSDFHRHQTLQLCRQAEQLARWSLDAEGIGIDRRARALGERIIALVDGLDLTSDEGRAWAAELAEALASCDFALGNGALPLRLSHLRKTD